MSAYYAIGTSITAGASTETGDCFPKMLAKELNVNLVNLGVLGGTVGEKYHPNSDIWNPTETLAGITRKVKSLANTNFNKGDFITLECINDFRVSIDYDDFRNKLTEIFDTFKNNKSFIENEVKLYLLTPHKFGKSSGRPAYNETNLYRLLLEEYTDAMKNIASRYKFIKRVDMSNVFPATSEYVYDGVHLSVKAKQEYVKLLKTNINVNTNKKKVIAYIPLDDRPCNLDRVNLGAQAMGMELLIPPTNYFKNYLDKQGTNENGWQIGCPDKIESWLGDMTKEFDIDSYIISLDQLCSGGLIGARKFDHPISAKESVDRVKRVMDIIPSNKKVYLFDVVLRLATTIGFDGLDFNDYDASYKYASAPRRKITTTADELIARDEIIKNYNVDTNGNWIDPMNYGFNRDKATKYLEVRKRKFTLNCEVGKLLNKYKNAKFVFAVGDANNNDTIQTNEINHIKRHITSSSEQIFAGIDELGMTMLGRVSNDFYTTSPTKVKVTYFGSGKNMLADVYDVETLETNVNKHLSLIGAQVVDSNEDIEVLILTKPNPNNSDSKQHEEIEEQSGIIQWCVNNNTRNRNHPTIVIDASWFRTKGGHFQNRMLGNIGSPMELPKLLAYSNWNTVGNAVGMALGHGIGRYAYLKSQSKVNKREALEGQVKLLFTEYAKDICYIVGGKWKLDRDLGANADNFDKGNINTNSDWFKKIAYQGMTDEGLHIKKLANLFIVNGFVYEDLLNYKLTQINWINYPYEDGIDFFPITFPWKRTFECTFPVQASFK